MRARLMVMVLLLACLGTVPVVRADLVVKPGDTIQKLLEERKGKRVTLRLQGGEEITGKVRAVTGDLVQLGELSGREYFDAVVEVNRIAAVIVRVKEQ